MIQLIQSYVQSHLATLESHPFRFITYAQENWHLFMLGNNTTTSVFAFNLQPFVFLVFHVPSIPDFCYFVNLSVTLQTAFFPDHLLWYKVKTTMKLCL